MSDKGVQERTSSVRLQRMEEKALKQVAGLSRQTLFYCQSPDQVARFNRKLATALFALIGLAKAPLPTDTQLASIFRNISYILRSQSPTLPRQETLNLVEDLLWFVAGCVPALRNRLQFYFSQFKLELESKVPPLTIPYPEQPALYRAASVLPELERGILSPLFSPQCRATYLRRLSSDDVVRAAAQLRRHTYQEPALTFICRICEQRVPVQNERTHTDSCENRKDVIDSQVKQVDDQLLELYKRLNSFLTAKRDRFTAQRSKSFALPPKASHFSKMRSSTSQVLPFKPSDSEREQDQQMSLVETRRARCDSSFSENNSSFDTLIEHLGPSLKTEESEILEEVGPSPEDHAGLYKRKKKSQKSQFLKQKLSSRLIESEAEPEVPKPFLQGFMTAKKKLLRLNGIHSARGPRIKKSSDMLSISIASVPQDDNAHNRQVPECVKGLAQLARLAKQCYGASISKYDSCSDLDRSVRRIKRILKKQQFLRKERETGEQLLKQSRAKRGLARCVYDLDLKLAKSKLVDTKGSRGARDRILRHMRSKSDNSSKNRRNSKRSTPSRDPPELIKHASSNSSLSKLTERWVPSPRRDGSESRDTENGYNTQDMSAFSMAQDDESPTGETSFDLEPGVKFLANELTIVPQENKIASTTCANEAGELMRIESIQENAFPGAFDKRISNLTVPERSVSPDRRPQRSSTASKTSSVCYVPHNFCSLKEVTKALIIEESNEEGKGCSPRAFGHSVSQPFELASCLVPAEQQSECWGGEQEEIKEALDLMSHKQAWTEDQRDSEEQDEVITLSRDEENLGRQNSSLLRESSSGTQGDSSYEHLTLHKCRSMEFTPSMLESVRRLDQERLSIQNFRLVKRLSHGAYGDVVLAEKKTSKDLFAVKIMKVQDVLQKNQQDFLSTEKEILNSVNSDFVVHGAYSFRDDQYFYIAMEYLAGGDLAAILEKEGRFEWEQARFYVKEIVQALQYLRSMDYIHRDLKPDNILLDKTGHLKLTDFGLSKAGLEQKKEQLSSPSPVNMGRKRSMAKQRILGTPHYMAPEVVQGKEHSFSLDYWSLGVITYQLAVGTFPFYGDTVQALFSHIQSGEVEYPPVDSEVWPRHLDDFIHRLLDPNPETRLGAKSIDEIKNHPFLAGVDWASKGVPPHVPNCKTPAAAGAAGSSNEQLTWSTYLKGGKKKSHKRSSELEPVAEESSSALKDWESSNCKYLRKLNRDAVKLALKN